ncbi:MAG: NAD(+) synthase [Treponema sp.]|nr:NAD(+) synthase [Treponema sp.]
MNYGFFRVAAASPKTVVADCSANADAIIASVREAHAKGASLVVFPELCVTGYTCGDLFFQRTLLSSAIFETERIASECASLPLVFAVGLPFAFDGALYNCAALIFRGTILALVPKTFIPNHGEFYERRYFASGKTLPPHACARFSEQSPCVPFGTDILLCDEHHEDVAIAAEICEDVWAALSPSTRHALSGATVIANLSASNEVVGKKHYRRLLVQSHSAKTMSAYVYADCGRGESTQDAVFAGHNLIAENGALLAESRLFSGEMIVADVDVERIAAERCRTTTCAECAEYEAGGAFVPHDACSAADSTRNSSVSCTHAAMHSTRSSYRKIYIDICSYEHASVHKNLARTIAAHPFVPSDEKELDERCHDILLMQAEGLAQRLSHIGVQKAVIGLSGGLDSTLALLATCRAFDRCALPRSNILSVTMPCFGTTDRTYNNAGTLARETGSTLLEIPIAEAVRIHFCDIGHDETVQDVTYENAQARERTQVLMDIANKENALVVGTGDLSELALGWCTYNGDHMSMYGVNSSIPKTLVRHVVSFCARTAERETLAAVLNDILATPVSPELLPPRTGKIAQKTEDIVGPYDLHDFYLYYLLRFGFSPEKILFLADATDLPFSHEEKITWLRVFYKRFFSQQFKRSCMPDGAKVGTISLSPRSDWRMPSDASAAAWLKAIETLS